MRESDAARDALGQSKVWYDGRRAWRVVIESGELKWIRAPERDVRKG